MSNYIAKQYFGDKAFYGIARLAFNHNDRAGGMGRIWGGFSIVLPEDDSLPHSQQWQLLDSEIYIVPRRIEVFRGMRGLRVDQILTEYHFAHPFGLCVEREGHCSQCEDAKLPPYDKDSR